MSEAARRPRHASTATAGASPPASPASGRHRRGEGLVKARTVRLWSVVHAWTSLISTVFLLLLCLTGLPLIFHHEIDELLGYAPRPETARDGEQKSTVDRIAGAALANDPGKV